MKHMGFFNKALLCKWKWRILTEKYSTWRNILEARYGYLNQAVLRGSDHKTSVKDSVWWKDLCAASTHKTNTLNCFAGNIRFVLGKGNTIPFWHGKWIGGIPLKQAFRIVFNLSHRPNAMVCEMGGWQQNSWRRELDCQGDMLLENPSALMEAMELIEILASINPVESLTDSFKWWQVAKGAFTVKVAMHLCGIGLIKTL